MDGTVNIASGSGYELFRQLVGNFVPIEACRSALLEL
jgi:hypothetical protein